jgi:hypothetical protein
MSRIHYRTNKLSVLLVDCINTNREGTVSSYKISSLKTQVEPRLSSYTDLFSMTSYLCLVAILDEN